MVKQKNKWLSGLAVGALLCAALPAHAAIIYANQVTAITRGDTSIGNSPGYYGWNINLGTVVTFTEAQAKNAVLGAPDEKTLGLPGNNDVPQGNPWPYAYVEVGFGRTFTTDDKLILTEYGYSGAENARLWLWATDGGVIETDISRGSTSTGNFNIVVDLNAWNGLHSGFNRVGIGGLDLSGGSQGFDLNAIGLDAAVVPLPAAGWLFVSGLLGLGLSARRRSMH